MSKVFLIFHENVCTKDCKNWRGDFAVDKEQCLQRIIKTGVIAVIRAEGADQAIKIAEAVHLGGIDVIEITMTVPGAVEVIAQLTQAFSRDEIAIGAGTVLDSETARSAILAGAEYIVSPHLNSEVVKLCNRYQKLCMPGAMTITEIVTAMEIGADVVKLFPGNVLGPDYVKAVKGPLPQAKLIPTGGVNLDNVDQWIKNGCLAVGVGGKLTAGAAVGDYAKVTETAKSFVAAVKNARGL